jgi:hypothetical protein
MQKLVRGADKESPGKLRRGISSRLGMNLRRYKKNRDGLNHALAKAWGWSPHPRRQ